MATLVKVEVIGARDLLGRFQRVTQAVATSQRDEMRTLGQKTVTALREEAPVRTGRLRAGITYQTRQAVTTTELSVYSAAPYTRLVIRGRGPVVARRARALRFEPGPPGSGFIFRHRVGPAKPNPFQARALGRLGGEPYDTARRMAVTIEGSFAGR